jgi:hypothetical protein
MADREARERSSIDPADAPHGSPGDEPSCCANFWQKQDTSYEPFYAVFNNTAP